MFLQLAHTHIYITFWGVQQVPTEYMTGRNEEGEIKREGKEEKEKMKNTSKYFGEAPV